MNDVRLKAWSKAFATYLEKNGISRIQAAYEIGVGYATIHAWIKAELATVPSAAYQKRVEKWSKGKVKAIEGTGSPRLYPKRATAA